MNDALERADLADVAGSFGQLLHAAGVPVTPERAGRFAAVIALALPVTVDELYWLARVTLVSELSQIDTFDRVFQQLFAGIVDPADSRGQPIAPAPMTAPHGYRRDGTHGDRRGTVSAPSPATTAEGGVTVDKTTQTTTIAAWSSDERLRTRDFESLTNAELLHLRALMAEMALAPPPRRSRRRHVSPLGAKVDQRATLRRAHRTAGDPVALVLRHRRSKPRRVVFLCDISGSMEPYGRAYLQLLHCAVGAARAETFVFATRLTRLTRSLRATNPDHALYRAGRVAPDWSGGTRIGAALKSFNDQYGQRGMARGAVVVIVSDGWERDDPARLRREMERLSRLAHRVIWVNPRAANPGYEPLVGGMAAALPFVDDLVTGHSLDAMRDLLLAVAQD